jgi:hypothetical protein
MFDSSVKYVQGTGLGSIRREICMILRGNLPLLLSNVTGKRQTVLGTRPIVPSTWPVISCTRPVVACTKQVFPTTDPEFIESINLVKLS